VATPTTTIPKIEAPKIDSNPITQNTSAVTGTVDPNSTVQGQITGLLDQNNPYMQRATTEGLQFANKRGLLNSSMAAGATQAARIDAALPIAQQDAQTYWGQQQLNQNAQNQFGLATHQGDVQRQLADQGYQQDVGLIGAQAQAQEQLSASDQLRDLEKMAAEQGYTLEQMAKQQGLDIGVLREQALLQEDASSADQVRLLEQMATSQGYTLDQMAKQYNLDIGVLREQALLQEKASAADQLRIMEQLATEQGYTLEQMADQYGKDLAILERQNEMETLLQEDQQAFQETILGLDHANQQEILALEATLQSQLQAENNAAAETLARLEGDYKLTANLDTALGEQYTNTLEALGLILSNESITGAQQTAAIDGLTTMLESSLEYLSGEPSPEYTIGTVA